MPFRGPSLPERLLGGAVLLVLAALALGWAVELVLSIFWPLVGIAGLALTLVVAWRLYEARRGGW